MPPSDHNQPSNSFFQIQSSIICFTARAMSATCLVNNIPRGTLPETLICSLAEHWRVHDGPFLYPSLLQTLESEPVIQDSRLDDDLSITIIKFRNAPMWFRTLDRDHNGFPKISDLGTLWRGVDLTCLDGDHRKVFTRAVIAGDLVYAETLAEFSQIDINSQDKDNRTALH